MNNLSSPSIPRLSKFLARQDIIVGLIIATLLINVLALCFPLALLQIYDRIIPNKTTDTLLLLMLSLIAIILFETALKIARAYICTWGDAKLNFNLGNKIFAHLLNANLLDLEKKAIGANLEQINALDSCKQLAGSQSIITMLDVPFIFLYVAVIAYINVNIAYVVLSLQALLALYVVINNNAINQQLKLQTKQKAVKTNFMLETLANIHTIKSLGMETMQARKFENMTKEMSVADYYAYLRNNSLVQAGNFITQLNIITVVACGTWLIIHHQLSVGALAGCTLLSIRAMQPLAQIILLWKKVRAFNLAKLHYLEIINLPQSADYLSHQVAAIQGKIAVQNISFRYNQNDPWILQNINLTIPAGTAIAISQGYGKTTLLSLLAALIPPSKGEIIIDDTYDLAKCNTISYREQIALIPQHGNLFAGTILDNLCEFAPAATIDLNLVHHVLQELAIMATIANLPHGLQTYIGNQIEDCLSRGFRQQLLIARALISQPKIILFDEAHTSLDSQAIDKLTAYLRQLNGKVTIIMATNNQQLLSLAERVFCLHKGRLVPSNTNY